MRVYYNEYDRFAVEWLKELIDLGHLPPGDIDDRSICDVQPNDIVGYSQCHFFAGIGGWPLALKQAGWGDRPVWSGSCPCQPFSTAGQRKGKADDRHLWPVWFRLIQECQPPTIFGEQVASKDALAWFDDVQADMESQDYACTAIDLCAAGLGAPHLRQRLFWVADRDHGIVGDTNSKGLEEREVFGRGGTAYVGSARETSQFPGCSLNTAGHPGPTNGFWRDADWLRCRDEKWRAVESGTFPLVDGAPARLGPLRGYGNAIVVPVAVEFIKAFIES